MRNCRRSDFSPSRNPNSFKKENSRKTEKKRENGRFREIFEDKSTIDFLARVYRLSTFKNLSTFRLRVGAYRLLGVARGGNRPGQQKNRGQSPSVICFYNILILAAAAVSRYGRGNVTHSYIKTAINAPCCVFRGGVVCLYSRV